MWTDAGLSAPFWGAQFQLWTFLDTTKLTGKEAFIESMWGRWPWFSAILRLLMNCTRGTNHPFREKPCVSPFFWKSQPVCIAPGISTAPRSWTLSSRCTPGCWLCFQSFGSLSSSLRWWDKASCLFMESRNCLGWKRPLTSWSPNV